MCFPSFREFKFGDSVDDQQVGCLWQNSHLLTVSLSGHINYLNPAAASGSSPSEFILRTIKGHSKSITALEVAYTDSASPLIFSGSHDGVIIHWNSATGQMNSIAGSSAASQHRNQVQAIRFDQVNDQLVTCGFDDVLKFIDLKEFKYV